MLDAGGNFISENSRNFSKNIEQAALSSNYHHSNGQAEASIKFLKKFSRSAYIPICTHIKLYAD